MTEDATDGRPWPVDPPAPPGPASPTPVPELAVAEGVSDLLASFAGKGNGGDNGSGAGNSNSNGNVTQAGHCAGHRRGPHHLRAAPRPGRRAGPAQSERVPAPPGRAGRGHHPRRDAPHRDRAARFRHPDPADPEPPGTHAGLPRRRSSRPWWTGGSVGARPHGSCWP